ncbi:MAG: hypothetical protein Q8O55_10620 [Dehalococcoidales bacterium]|nr:hypothetical protein [Dehalococcoidales bacterium]
MVMWRLKGCPRCGGDFYVSCDMDGWFEQCLQCSYRIELKSLVEFKEPVLSGGGDRAGKAKKVKSK